MGVQCRMTIYSTNVASAEESAKAAFERISQIESAVSDYRVDSDVAWLAKAAGSGEFVAIAPETQFLLIRSCELARASNGAFDPTVGPVTKLWRSARRDQKMPEESIRRTAADLVNFHRIELSKSSNGAPVARLQREGMSLDFGAIAKGYAAEEAVKMLRAMGTSTCLVALSGDIYAGDAPPGARGWRIAISSGQQQIEVADAYVMLENQGLSTSGDTEQIVELDGMRYSHIIDPRIGWAISERRSVTVIGPHGWMHDALATALCVLDEAASRELLKKYPDCAAVIFERIDDQVQRRMLGNPEMLRTIEFTSK